MTDQVRDALYAARDFLLNLLDAEGDQYGLGEVLEQVEAALAGERCPL